MRKLFATFGVPAEVSTDSGPQFKGGVFQDFLSRWGIHHRISSAHHPSSNGRAELAVKMTKRLLRNNTTKDGKLDTDEFVRALLTKRNTPDPTSGLSPAEILMGRKLRDSMPSIPKDLMIMNNPMIREGWREAWKAKEEALRIKYTGVQERLRRGSKRLQTLEPGDTVSVQNQNGQHPKVWGKTGTVVEVQDYDQYIVKIHGSGRLTRRNRQFLRKFSAREHFFGTQQDPKDQQRPVTDIQQPPPISQLVQEEAEAEGHSGPDHRSQSPSPTRSAGPEVVGQERDQEPDHRSQSPSPTRSAGPEVVGPDLLRRSSRDKKVPTKFQDYHMD